METYPHCCNVIVVMYLAIILNSKSFSTGKLKMDKKKTMSMTLEKMRHFALVVDFLILIMEDIEIFISKSSTSFPRKFVCIESFICETASKRQKGQGNTCSWIRK